MAGSHTSTYLQVEDTNVLKLVVALRRKGPIARALSTILNYLKKCDVIGVPSYCRDVLGYSRDEYTKAFYPDEQKILRSSTSFEDLDITLLYKLLQRICGLSDRQDKSWSKDAVDTGCLEHLLFLLKEKRNILFHCIISICEDKLHKEFGEMIALVKTAFTKTGEIAGKDMSQQGQEMEKELYDLLWSALPPVNLKEYQQSLSEIRSSLVLEIKREGKLDLQDLYSKFWVVSPITWVSDDDSRQLLVNKVYTPVQLKCVQTVDIEKVLVTLSADGSLPRVICLSGIAGAGKTTICRYLTYCWCKDTASIPGLVDVDLIFVIQCRYVYFNSLKEHIVNELLVKACSHLSDSDILPTLKKCNVLFVFDSLEEAGPEAKKLLEEALRWPPPCRVIVTTRPEFEENAVKIIHSRLGVQCLAEGLVKKFRILNFDSERRNSYIEKLFSILVVEETDRVCKMNEFFNYLNVMERIICTEFQLPLILCLMVLLWLEDKKKVCTIQTISGLYFELIDLNLRRLAEKLQRKTCLDFDDILFSCYEKFLYALGKESFSQIEENRTFLDKKSVERIKKACYPEIDPTQAISSIMMCAAFVSRKKVINHWTFSYRTYQVFAAYYLCKSFEINEIPLRFDKCYGHELYVPVFVFAFGLLHLDEPGSATTMEQLGELLGVVSFGKSDSFIFNVCVEILRETENSESGTGIVDKLLEPYEAPSDIMRAWQTLPTLLQYTSLKVPPIAYCRSLPNTSLNAVIDLGKVLKGRRCYVQFYIDNMSCSSKLDSLMIFDSLVFSDVDYIETAFNIGLQWAGHIQDKSRVIMNLHYGLRADFDLEGKSIPSVSIMSSYQTKLHSITVGFIQGVQKSFPDMEIVLSNFCIDALDPDMSYGVLYIASQVSLAFPEGLDIGPLWSNDLLFLKQIIERRKLSVKFSGSVYVTKGTDFNVILDNFTFLEQHFTHPIAITVNVENFTEEKQVRLLGQRWGEMIKRDSGSMIYEAVFFNEEIGYFVIINVKGNKADCSFIWKCYVNSLPILLRCIAMFMEGLRLCGLQNRSRKITQLKISQHQFGHKRVVKALKNILKEWTPECTIKLSVMEVTDEICSFVSYLDAEKLKRTDLDIAIRNEDDLLYLTTNMKVVKGFCEEYGFKINFGGLRFAYRHEAVKDFCQEWVSDVGDECHININVSFDEGFEVRLCLSSSKGQQSIIFKGIYSSVPINVLRIFLAKFQEMGLDVSKKLITCKNLVLQSPVDFDQLINIFSEFPLSVEKPVVIKRACISGFKLFEFCRMVESHGSYVQIADGLVITQECEHDVRALTKNMEWSLQLFLDNHLKLLYKRPTLDYEHFKTLGESWAKVLINSKNYALKVECAHDQVNPVIILLYESEGFVSKMSWADEPNSSLHMLNDFSMFMALCEFLQGFQKAVGKLEYGMLKITKFDLAKFRNVNLKCLLHGIPFTLNEVTELECAVLDSTFISLLKDIEKRDSSVQILNCLVLREDSLPLVLKTWRRIQRLFKDSQVVFGLQRHRIPSDLYSFGKKLLQNLGVHSMDFKCTQNGRGETEVICKVDITLDSPSITWKYKKVTEEYLSPTYQIPTVDIYTVLQPFLKAVIDS